MLRSLASLRALAPASSSAWSTGAVVSGARPFGFGSHRSGNDPETVEKEKDKQVKGAASTYTQHNTLMNVLRNSAARAWDRQWSWPLAHLQHCMIFVLTTKHQLTPAESSGLRVSEP